MTAGNNEVDDLTLARGDFLIERHIATAMPAAHWHDHVELNLLLEGEMTYLFNGRREEVEAGRLVLFWAAIPHQTIAVTGNAALIVIYLPLADFLALPIDREARRFTMQGGFLSDPAATGHDGFVAARWVEEWNEGEPQRRSLLREEIALRVRRFILDCVETGRLSGGEAGTAAVAAAVRHVEALTDLVNSHYGEPVLMPDLAARAGIHPSTANKAFRDVLGLSVNEYLTRYRVARAMQKLVDTEDPILTIAYDCGFGSSSRFYELFKARTGQTPLAFRRALSRKG
ncbi:helix-turn-helix domain-containing protein [Martelella mediterranea]|uniref:Melibiose operon regulatory protein n=1 Tax=Martelella mediterranea DSM 17316 TaxID=1122214 RepID=A0A1U9Z5H7_9HYPH|nr:helix-turn-helix domain-containing protein [Martelella mediterranea]AQZ52928.1 Melibiose operon regulatory protein [Martelella mediterranea DSM 17316]